MKKGRPDTLTPRERSLFNTKLSLYRIKAAKMYLLENASAEVKEEGGWNIRGNVTKDTIFVLLLKNSFVDKFQEYLKTLPFSSDIHSAVHSILKEQKLDDLLVVTEADMPGCIWDTLSDADFRVLVLTQRDDESFICYSSVGRDYLRIDFARPHSSSVHYYHYCNAYDILKHFHVMSEDECAVGDARKNKIEFIQEVGAPTWICSACNFHFYLSDIKPDVLNTRYAEVFNGKK